MRYWNASIITFGPGAEFSFVALKPYGTNVKFISASSARGFACQEGKIDELNTPLPPPPPSGSVLYVTLYEFLLSERRGGVLDYRWALLLAQDAKPET